MLVVDIVFPFQTSCHTSLGKVTSIIDGLKRLYNEKLKPLEVAYRYNDFASPLLVRELHDLTFGLL